MYMSVYHVQCTTSIIIKKLLYCCLSLAVDPMCLDDDDATVKKKPVKLVSSILQSCLFLSIVLVIVVSCSSTSNCHRV